MRLFTILAVVLALFLAFAFQNVNGDKNTILAAKRNPGLDRSPSNRHGGLPGLSGHRGKSVHHGGKNLNKKHRGDKHKKHGNGKKGRLPGKKPHH